MGFLVRMKEAEKSLASKTEVNDALDLEDKNRGKQKNFKQVIQIISFVKVISKMIMGHRNI